MLGVFHLNYIYILEKKKKKTLRILLHLAWPPYKKFLAPPLIGKKTSLDCTASATPLSEEIKLELIFEEEWKYVFKLRVTILIYEYLFAMIVS